MGNKKIGIICISAGSAALLVVLFFMFFGSMLFLNPGYEFEPEQTPPSSTTGSYDESIAIPGMESMTVKADSKMLLSNFIILKAIIVILKFQSFCLTKIMKYISQNLLSRVSNYMKLN